MSNTARKPRFFRTPAALRKWFETNHDKADELWIGFYKKASGKKAVDYVQALDEALCFGWIDGIVNKYDDESYMQRFTPRRARSKWSAINTGHVERLIAEKRMTPAGMAAVEAAKADGRWAAAYVSPGRAEIPDDLKKAVRRNPKAKAFLATLNRANIYAIAYRLQNAKKAETRERWIQRIVAMLESHETFH